MLLLDESTAGRHRPAPGRPLPPLLTELRDVLGATTVIVEHDIPMITGLVDPLDVLAADVIAESGASAAAAELGGAGLCPRT